MEAERTFETSDDNYFTRQYIPEDKSELHNRRRVFEDRVLRRIFGLMRSFIIVLVPKYQYEGEVKENEVGRASSRHGRGEKSVQGFGGKARRKETT
jgi:hypothetical protein